MKILHLISQMPDMTGSGKYLQAVVNCARQSGHENFLVAGVQDNFTLAPGLIDPDCSLYVNFNTPALNFPIPGMSDVMPYPSRVFATLSPLELRSYEVAFKEKIAAAVHQFKPDLIHSHHLWQVSAFATEVAPAIPMVVSCHGTCLRQLALCPHLKEKPLELSQKVSGILALSRVQAQEIISTYPAARGKTHVVGAGFDQHLFFPVAKPTPPPVEILYAGKLCRAKGVPWLLKSLKPLGSLPWRLHLAGSGSGEEQRTCKELAAEFGDQVCLHGTLTHPELARLMGRTHLFVLPSFFEGLPLVLMEALASGCTIVTTALPGTCEVLSGITPGRVKFLNLPPLATVDTPHGSDLPRLEQALTRILARIIGDYLEQGVSDMPMNDRLTGEYTWEKVFEKIEAVYKKALKG
ncbi:putative glycogen synthase (starch [bacterial glycogen] synthase) [Desulforapulum autotrophicum HRM2]|uniref:Glycogen synthase (Starch [bacterial glycogen] synthase) n=1 Tax=Desulforapulum autotrophicum (strain ATCC 43914 / DSM 3382 / VKM B-1955 / HRM2) TaxID=177437 RepID=C0QFG1_DESAH|nr:glycosyltransferase family 4 protein [Desulforapulum autotrophicum]ACN13357.1 putative glycogen synthase (starch [bacterial glycogen] synthase) [Desulforapulum autotrophicum HRM2]